MLYLNKNWFTVHGERFTVIIVVIAFALIGQSVLAVEDCSQIYNSLMTQYTDVCHNGNVDDSLNSNFCTKIEDPPGTQVCEINYVNGVAQCDPLVSTIQSKCSFLKSQSFCTGNCEATSANTAESETAPFTEIKPRLQINIPGLAPFTNAFQSKGYLNLPYLSEYISGVYNYLVGIAGIFATIMIMYGGMKWIFAAGDATKISAAKDTIIHAVIGLVLALGSYVILYSLNPALVNFEAFKLIYIERVELEVVSPAVYKAATGRDIVAPSAVKEMVKQKAREKGIDECAFDAVVGQESGYKVNRIGHDEWVPRTQVKSRRDFIKSGIKYSGASFTPGDGYTDRTLLNDDRFDPGSPPNFGLDPRFTHGIGLGQFTILLNDSETEMTRCPDGNIGRTFGNQCYNAVELIDPETQLNLSADLFNQISRRAGGNLEKIFYSYAGSGCSARVAQCNKMKAYSQCKGTSNYERSDCRSWLNEQNSNCKNPNYR